MSIARGQHKAVHSQAIAMIKADVKHAVPYCLLAVIASEHGNHLKARELFARSAELAPENGQYHAFLARSLSVAGQQKQAKEAIDRAVARPIEDASFYDTVGVVYSRTGYHESAIEFFKKAVAMQPLNAGFHYNLASSQQFLGEFDEAATAYQTTLRLDPTAYKAWSSLVGLKRQTREKNYLDRLQEEFDRQQEDPDASLHLGHALAKTLEDLGEYEQSLQWLIRAKRLKREDALATPMQYTDIFAAAKETLLAHTDRASSRIDDAPIFVIGMPRTGTTLVDRILSSHPSVVSAGELNIFAGLIKEAVKTPSNMVMDGPTLRAATQVDLEAIGRSYLEESKALSRGAPRFVDKMPFNFFYAGLIHKALPNARIILLRRGAMDSCLSNFRQLLTVQHSYYQYTYDLAETAAFFAQFDSLMAQWREQLPQESFMEVNYEDIVHDQEQQTRRMLAFCDLDWNEACMRFHENDAPVSTASSVQVRQPLYSGSIGRWQRYGDALEGLRKALGDLAK